MTAENFPADDAFDLFRVLNTTIERVQQDYQRLHHRLDEANHDHTRLKNACRQLEGKCSLTLQQNTHLTTEKEQLQQQLADAKAKQAELERLVNELSQANSYLTKENHDLELALMQKNNEYDTILRQAQISEEQTQKKLDELSRTSTAVQKMREMLAGVETLLPKQQPETTTPAEAGATRAVDESFERWLNPRESRIQDA